MSDDILLTMLLLGLLALTNFAYTKNAVAQEGDTINATSMSSSHFFTYQNPLEGFKFEYPPYWQKTELITSNGFSVYFIEPLSEARFGVITFKIPQSSLNEPKDLILTSYQNKFFRTLPSSNITKYSSAIFVGIPAKKLEFTFINSAGNQDRGMMLGFVSKDRIYLLVYVASKLNYSLFLPTAQQMINSFAVVPPTTSTSPSVSTNMTAATNNSLPVITTSNTGSISAANTSTSTQINRINRIYTNNTDGISLLIPPGWSVEAGQNSVNDTGLEVIHMAPPISQDPNAQVNVYVYKDTKLGTNSSLIQYLRDKVVSLESNRAVTNFRLILGSTNITVAEHPGYQLQVSYSLGNSPLRVMDTGFLLGGNVYYVWYVAPPNLYSTLLPQVNGIIQSIKVNPP